MSRSPRPALLATVTLGAAAILAACGGGTASTATSSGGPAASLPAGTYAVEAKDGYAFSPASLTVPAGEVTFRVTNTDDEEHEFEIFQGETVVDEIEGLLPGLTLELTPTEPLEPGQYQFKCLLNGHDQLGMTGTLTVTGS